MHADALSKPSTQFPPAASAAPALQQADKGFFVHHGLWAPGIRTFRSVGLHGNSIVISLVFAIPIALLAWSAFTEKATVLAFSQKERIGVAYVRDALELTHQAERVRGLATVAAAGGQPSAELDAAGRDLDSALKKMGETESALGAAVGTAKAYAAVIESGKSLVAASEGADKVFASHSVRVQAALDLVTAATDGANLTLDPDLDSSYLIDGAVLTMPRLIDNAAQLRDRGAAAVASKAISPLQLRRLVESKTRADFLHGGLVQAIAKATELHADLAPGMNIDSVRKAFDKLYDLVGETLYTGDSKVEGDAKVFFDAGSQTIDALRATDAQMLDALDSMLAVRVGQLQATRTRLAIVTVLCLFMAAYLFVCFRKVLEGGISNLAHHMREMSQGDLATRPQSWGRDELAELIDTTNTMQISLHGMLTRIRSNSDAMDGASQKVALAARDLALRTDATTASLGRTAGSMTGMQTALDRTAQGTSEAVMLATQNAEMAARGGEVIGAAVATMQGIQKSSARIADIISVIDGIAFQTNILALNAAVEAARAGEHGKGFAVVASEVRSLAQRSTGAAREIKSLIDASVSSTRSGASVVQEAGATMKNIVDAARRVNELLGEISQMTKDQSANITQVSQDMTELESLNHHSAALVGDTAVAAESMLQLAAGLGAEVGRFRL